MIIDNFVKMLIFLEKNNEKKKILYKDLSPRYLSKDELQNLSKYKIFLIKPFNSKEISYEEFLNIDSRNKFLFINNTYKDNDRKI